MSEYQILLPKDVYDALLKVAQEKGMTPVDWITSKLPASTPEEQPLSKLLTGLVGAINSQEEPRHRFQSTPFGDKIADKLAKQGLRRS